MSGAVVLAIVAGTLAAAGVVELSAAWRPGGRRGSGALVSAIGRVGRRLGAKPPAGLAERIDAAGLATPAGEVMALKVGAVPAFALAVLPLGSATPGRLGIALLLIAPVAGFLAPDLWLRARARARARTIERELADVLDLLRVACAAGLGMRRGLGEVGRRHPGLLAAELAATARLLALGVPVDRALGALERRCRAAGLPALVALLARTEQLGAPPGPALAALAADARARRARRAAEHAARAAPKIQLVVALLLVPSVLLLVAAALLPALGGAAIR